MSDASPSAAAPASQGGVHPVAAYSQPLHMPERPGLPTNANADVEPGAVSRPAGAGEARKPGVVRMLIADDHVLVRDLVARVCAEQPDIEIVGQVADAQAALEHTLALKPDIVLLDIEMPGASTFDAAIEIAERCEGARVLIVSAYAHDRYIDRALEAGCWGYVVKHDDPTHLLEAIRSVARDEPYYSQAIKERLLTGRTRGAAAGPRSRRNALTDRELEVLVMLAHGYSKRTVADRLDLKQKTIEKHSSNIMTKLGLHDRVALCRYAIREGIVQP